MSYSTAWSPRTPMRPLPGVRRSVGALMKSKPAPQSSETGRLFARVSKPLANRDPSSLPPRGQYRGRGRGSLVRRASARARRRLPCRADCGGRVDRRRSRGLADSVDDPHARRYLLSRFPYSIVYVVAVDGGITVAATT